MARLHPTAVAIATAVAVPEWLARDLPKQPNELCVLRTLTAFAYQGHFAGTWLVASATRLVAQGFLNQLSADNHYSACLKMADCYVR